MASNEHKKSIDSTPSLVKRPRISTPVLKASSGNEKATLTDLSVFDCPICSLALSSTVYRCENGHVACGRCCTKIENKCPSCCSPIGTNRCSVLEKVLDTVTVSCRNAFRGCTKTIKLNEKFYHEEIECDYMPCVCPYDNCNFVDIAESLFKHFGKTHRPSTFRFNDVKSIVMEAGEEETLFFQDISRGTLFVLKSVIEARGNLLTVACVGPDSMSEAFSFSLKAELDKDTYVKSKGVVVCEEEMPSDMSELGKYLLVPRDMVDKEGKLNLKLTLRRNHVSAVNLSG